MVLTAAEAVRLAEEAVAVAQVSAAMNTDRVELAPEPVHADGEWVSAYEIDPFTVPDAEKTGLLTELSERLLAADGVEHVQRSCMHVKEQKYYADTSGTRTRQQRVRIDSKAPVVRSTASAVNSGWTRTRCCRVRVPAVSA